MATIVKGDLYEAIDGKLHEIKRQVRQSGGYPYEPERLDLALQAIVEGRFEEIVRQQPTPKPPLVGTVVKTLHLKPNKMQSIKNAIKLGKYDGVTGDIVELFASDEVSLTEAADIQLVQFDRDPFYDEMLAWGTANNKKPMLGKHLHAIAVQYPEEHCLAPIVALGSVQHGSVLSLRGNSFWRYLNRYTGQSRWYRSCLFGFLSE